MPRLIVAFPAGNTGIGLWFQKTDKDVRFDVSGALDGVERGAMHGVAAMLESNAARLELRGVVLGSIRTLRVYVALGTNPPETERFRAVSE